VAETSCATWYTPCVETLLDFSLKEAQPTKDPLMSRCLGDDCLTWGHLVPSKLSNCEVMRDERGERTASWGNFGCADLLVYIFWGSKSSQSSEEPIAQMRGLRLRWQVWACAATFVAICMYIIYLHPSSVLGFLHLACVCWTEGYDFFAVTYRSVLTQNHAAGDVLSSCSHHSTKRYIIRLGQSSK
jgi:hypothetical protein